MSINLKTTQGIAQSGVKVLVYGQSGAGKTTLIKTLPDPLILSAEGGLLSLANENLPYIEIHNLDELGEALTFITDSEEGRQFKSIALDSISEIAEVVLSAEKIGLKDGRAAYGSMNDIMAKVIRAFRDLPDRNVYFSAKMEKQQTDTGAMLYAPSMPGARLSQGLAYFFDEVLALRLTTDKDGAVQRALQCQSDPAWLAKDRSGRLSMWEPADLGAVISKISGAEPQRPIKGSTREEARKARENLPEAAHE
ncbi:MAG: ATP-binding protein [Pyramidobacter sp.]|nr:ATP-binding protein [Pyramidobacter sp.]